MASDTIVERGGELASLSDHSIEDLKEALPTRASLGNPVDITGDAKPKQYKKSVEICLKDENVDGVLCIYAPVGTMPPDAVAKAIVGLKDTTSKPILTSWMGGSRIQKAREILRQTGFSVQFSPEHSVKDYMYMYQYARNLERLLETPEEVPVDRAPPRYHLKAMVRRIAREDREILTEVESKKILRTYNIPTTEIHVAETPDEAAKYASRIGFPVVLKIHSYDITHKTEAGGVALNICSESNVREVYKKIVDEVKKNLPNAEIEGVTVQKMMQDKSIELILGSKKDPLFGSIIMFGKGGTDVEYYKDIAICLPPLNQTLARRLMEETRVYEQIKESQNSSKIIRLLEEHLLRLSQLIIDFPEIIVKIGTFGKTLRF